MTRVVFTCGDINGIGPEICVKTFSKIFQKKNNHQIIFICPKNIFEFYYKLTNASFDYQTIVDDSLSKNALNLIPLPDSSIKFRVPSKLSGKTAYKAISQALKLIKSNLADILVTAPISKEAFKLAKINFPGHTELLAISENSKNYLMLFLSHKIKAGLLTIHSPISKVPKLITKANLTRSIEVLNSTGKKDFKIFKPKIAVLGLNPHAGENGLIGTEENKIISPVIKSLKQKLDVSGPFVPDAFWGNKIYAKFDLILGMYHDQILIPFKLLNFSNGVNYTAGLNLIRTSPDHGTAYDIAGLNMASESSLFQSYKYALKIFQNRKQFIAKSKLH